MSKLVNLLKWGATLGKEPQTFLGARWIPPLLKRVPPDKQRLWALRILSLSPHYFFDGDNPAYRGMSQREYLETVFRLNADSRVVIYEKILRPHLSGGDVVLDYGCGPGFLAKATAPHVRKIFAVDISTGALECAKVVNAEPNIEYLHAAEELDRIADGSIDAVYSFAVVQHVTDEIFGRILANCRRKLKPGGRLLLHIQLSDDLWRTEADWVRDQTVKGRIKYKYGLHCFGRTAERYAELVGEHGFADIEIRPIAELLPATEKEVASQRMLTARRA